MSETGDDHEVRPPPWVPDGSTSASSLIDLPAPLRGLVQLLLRRGELSIGQLRAAVAAPPARDLPAAADLDAALARLTAAHWLTRSGSGEAARYRARLQAKTRPRRLDRVFGALDFGRDSAPASGESDDKGSSAKER